MLTSMDKLYESVAANGPVCVGLDTEISYLPTTDTAKTAGENVVAFNRALIDATNGVAGCYKVQIAYYESLGLDGDDKRYPRNQVPYVVNSDQDLQSGTCENPSYRKAPATYRSRPCWR